MPSGSCLCGDITYSFSGEPLMKAICHCLTCRKVTGSAYATAFLLPDPDAVSASPAATPEPKFTDFKLQSKTDTPLKQSAGVHEVGLDMTFYGCSKCPSTLFKRANGPFLGVLILFGGCLDSSDLEELGVPQAELWVKYRLPWIKELERAKQCQEFE
ncbi:Mss4-like protein [Exophiala viscosa]|uniref:Mss4-like protein n=1 Tax=Exophiala viscosa TaxID=2486360 RepID=A0AAN6I8H8_9EURO|nr:Mss4-like protein [Exophiala viscosa]KAI1628332.1 Mss4-like protein [Exophiala viscosa]